MPLSTFQEGRSKSIQSIRTNISIRAGPNALRIRATVGDLAEAGSQVPFQIAPHVPCMTMMLGSFAIGQRRCTLKETSRSGAPMLGIKRNASGNTTHTIVFGEPLNLMRPGKIRPPLQLPTSIQDNCAFLKALSPPQ